MRQPNQTCNNQPYRIYTVALANGEEAFTLTEAFDGADTVAATLAIIGDGVPQFYVETVANGQAAWTYDIFFTGPHLANVPELAIFDEGTGALIVFFLISLILPNSKTHAPKLNDKMHHSEER